MANKRLSEHPGDDGLVVVVDGLVVVVVVVVTTVVEAVDGLAAGR